MTNHGNSASRSAGVSTSRKMPASSISMSCSSHSCLRTRDFAPSSPARPRAAVVTPRQSHRMATHAVCDAATSSAPPRARRRRRDWSRPRSTACRRARSPRLSRAALARIAQARLAPCLRGVRADGDLARLIRSARARPVGHRGARRRRRLSTRTTDCARRARCRAACRPGAARAACRRRNAKRCRQQAGCRRSDRRPDAPLTREAAGTCRP